MQSHNGAVFMAATNLATDRLWTMDWESALSLIKGALVGKLLPSLIWAPSSFQNSRVRLKLHLLWCICTAIVVVGTFYGGGGGVPSSGPADHRWTL